MLGNLVIGPEKFVLFIDHNAFEPVADKIIEKLIGDVSKVQRIPELKKSKLSEEKLSIDVQKELQKLLEKSNVLLLPLSQLSQEYAIQDIVQLIHNTKKSSNAKQIFLWASTKNILDRKLVPFMEYLADIVVNFKNDKYLTVLTKKISGSVSRKTYQYQVNNFEIFVKEKRPGDVKKTSEEKPVDPESLATFKINISEESSEARKSLKLPYERTTELKTEPQIHYEPDSDDDFDYEDPDEDLYI